MHHSLDAQDIHPPISGVRVAARLERRRNNQTVDRSVELNYNISACLKVPLGIAKD